MNKSEFFWSMANLPPIENSSTGDRIWDAHRASIRSHAIKDDLGDLLRWSTITATMFVGEYELTNMELEELEQSPEWEMWRELIREPGFGRPHMYPKHNTSGNLINQAYQIKQWMDISGLKVKDMHSIVEFGGGYGAMALICHRLGGKNYTIIDFEEVGLIQKYYLSNVGVPVVCTTTQNLPNRCDLFISCYSISEAPESIRNMVFDAVKSNNYFISFQYIHDGVNMRNEFEEMAERTKEDIEWTFATRKHIAYHSYLVGKRKRKHEQ